MGKGADCKKTLASLAAVGTKEVKSAGKFTIPGLAMLKLKTKPATKAGKREMFGKGFGESQTCQDGCQGLRSVGAEEERLSLLDLPLGCLGHVDLPLQGRCYIWRPCCFVCTCDAAREEK